jgi:uncharacterized repeat protein (TIGR03806 family)
MRLLFLFAGLGAVLWAFRENPEFERKDKLSDYNFFQGKLSDLSPEPQIIPYTVNTPLFSNYAEKLRFIKFPENGKAVYNDSSALSFPEGTILIKNFYYPLDFRKPENGRQILETRLLVHESQGWQAYPYIWNSEQTEAFYDPSGETKTVSYTNASGKKVTSPYAIPNKNQCKGCHTIGNKMVPIGTTARQLNRDFNYSDGAMNQLIFFQKLGKIENLPADIPKLAVWNDPLTGSLNERARAYLDANCGHCHSPNGPANTSGLYLNISQRDLSHLGINKAPVAAGRGAGDLQFDIVPGEPHKSILIYRMRTNDPAIAMPEIGREQVHEEAVSLLQEWIKKNAFAEN